MRFHRLLLRGRRLAVRSKHGVTLQLDPNEYVDGFALRYGFYEEEVLDAITGRLSSGDVFWDVGANIGLHALTVKRLRPDVRVYAYEPNPTLASLMVSVCEENALEVTVLELALDSDTGRAKFFLHEGNMGRCSLHNWDQSPDIKHVYVATDTADSVIRNQRFPVPNVVKIDVEGNEQRVLDGMRETLGSPALHTVVFEDVTDKTSSVKTTLIKNGFTLERLGRREPTHHGLENYVAIRNGLAR